MSSHISYWNWTFNCINTIHMDFYVHLFLYLWENLYFERALHNMWSIHLSSNCAQVKRSKSKLRFTKSHFAPLQCKSMVTYDGSFNKRAFLPLAWFVIGYYGKPAPLTLAQCLIWVGSCSAKCQILDFLRSDIVFKRSGINMRCQFISMEVELHANVFGVYVLLLDLSIYIFDQLSEVQNHYHWLVFTAYCKA